MKERKFGSNLSLSELTFGTMRFKFNNDTEAEKLIKKTIDCGINTFHSSFEYESHEYFCQIFSKVKKLYPSTNFHHIVKLGEPHFDSDYFNPKRFERIIDKQLIDLGTDRIDIVQWLLRHTPNTNKYRIKILKESFLEFNETVESLKKKGKINCIGSHPYTKEFAYKCGNLCNIECWITYLNLVEIEWYPLLKDPFLAIRPLAGGGLLKNDHIWNFLKKHDFFEDTNKLKICSTFPLLHPNVKTIITSIKNLDQLIELQNIFENTYIDLDLFNSIISFLRKNKSIKLNEPID